MSKKRHYRSAEEKLALLKRHFVDKETVSEICEKEELAPSLFYGWQQELFAHGALCLNQGKKQVVKTAQQCTIVRLEKQLEQQDHQLVKKNEVIAELLEEHTALKKSVGSQ